MASHRNDREAGVRRVRQRLPRPEARSRLPKAHRLQGWCQRSSFPVYFAMGVLGIESGFLHSSNLSPAPFVGFWKGLYPLIQAFSVVIGFHAGKPLADTSAFSTRIFEPPNGCPVAGELASNALASRTSARARRISSRSFTIVSCNVGSVLINARIYSICPAAAIPYCALRRFSGAFPSRKTVLCEFKNTESTANSRNRIKSRGSHHSDRKRKTINFDW